MRGNDRIVIASEAEQSRSTVTCGCRPRLLRARCALAMTGQITMQVKSNASTFNFRVDGERGPWVLLSHGLATDLSMWDELADALSDRFRVLRYDARGH